MADDRESQRSAGHDAERAVAKGFNPLGVHALVENPVEKVPDKFSAIDLRFHGPYAGGDLTSLSFCYEIRQM